jgi:hypothetical protein
MQPRTGFKSRGVNLSDGQLHTLFVQYDPGTLRVWLDDPASEAILTISVNPSHPA